MSFENLSGQTLGQYELRDMLGQGGMGAVYRAVQANLKRDVAIKILPTSLALQSGYLERFTREAEIAAALQHPHIVPIIDYGMQRGISYVVMRLLTGGSLAQRINQRLSDSQPLASLGEAAHRLTQLASALDYAHSQGVIHRDIKTSNIMFDDQGNAYVVDFGIAKLQGASQNLTSAGMALGTSAYMPPEQWRTEPLTPAADQYAMAVTMYILLTGRIPYDSDTPGGLMYKHFNEMPTPPQQYRADLPESVSDVLNHALAKKPEDRYANMAAFAQAFQQAIGGHEGKPNGFFTFKVRGTPRPAPVTPISPPSGPATVPLTPVGSTPSEHVHTVLQPTPAPVPPLKPAVPPPPQKNRFYWGLGGVIIVLVGAIAFLLVNRQQPSVVVLPTATIAETSTTLPVTTPTHTPTTADIVLGAPTATHTSQPSPTLTVTPTPSPSLTATPTPSRTSTATATVTESPTPTATLTVTSSATSTASATATYTRTPTSTATVTQSATATFTPTRRPSATPTLLADSIRFEFDHSAPGTGWSGTEYANGITYIWMDRTTATLRLAVKTDHDLILRIRIYFAMSDPILRSLTLKVNQQTLPLNRIGDTAPAFFTATIPRGVLASSPDMVQIEFGISGTIVPSKGDSRTLGVAFDWLELVPTVPTPTPTPSTAGLPGRIVFTSGRYANPEIMLMDPSNPDSVQRMTNNLSTDAHPVLSPNGNSIAFNTNRTGNFDIYVVPSGGSVAYPVTRTINDETNPAWSPDGKRIAYSSIQSGNPNSQIYIVDLGLITTQQLSPSANFSDFNPSWSPDGKQIAFESTRLGNRDIYAVGTNGLGLDSKAINTALDSDPAWSPDGKQIAFASSRDGNFEIYVMDADGSHQHRLTTNFSRDEQPTWSPDGQYIAFVSDRSGNKDIWVMKAEDGTIVTNLTADSKDPDYDPDWGIKPDTSVAIAPTSTPAPSATPRPTNTPRPTATPIPFLGNIYDQDFSKSNVVGLSSEGWAIKKDEQVYCINNNNNRYGEYPSADINRTDYRETANYSIEMLVRFTSNAGHFAILTRLDANGLGYRHAVDFSGATNYGATQYYVGTNGYNDLGYANIYVRADTWYTLRAEVDGSTIRTFLNGQLASTRKDTHRDRGVMGIEAGPYVQVCIDDLVVRSLDRSSSSLQAAHIGQATSNAKLRLGPGTNFDAVSSVTKGENVFIIDTDSSGKWILIRRDENNGIQGWVSADFIQNSS